jgi:shikimate kinase
MGAGKSTVGRRLARRLRWRFVDLDREIERRTGVPIPEIFATRGEAGFRDAEVEATAGLDALERTVLAVGGGWFVNPRARALVDARTLMVWLRVSPAEAVRRLAASHRRRPLLSVEDPMRAAEALLRAREPAYAEADAVIDVDGRPVHLIAEEIARLITRRAAG